MTTLMVRAGTAEPGALLTRTGGVPSAPADLVWPRCASCAGAMRFLAQVLLSDVPGWGEDDRLVSVFLCRDDSGSCEEWDARGGGNRALVFHRRDLVAAAPPRGGDTAPGEVSAVDFVVEGGDYGVACHDWARRCGASARQVLGQVGGEPSWSQEDGTPDCAGCGLPMVFVAQFEEHRAIGAGTAYAFACRTCDRAAFIRQR